MKLNKCILMMFALTLTTGCVSSQYCDVAKKIEPSKEDVLTDITAKQILAEQRKFKDFCESKWGV